MAGMCIFCFQLSAILYLQCKIVKERIGLVGNPSVLGSLEHLLDYLPVCCLEKVTEALCSLHFCCIKQ